MRLLKADRGQQAPPLRTERHHPRVQERALQHIFTIPLALARCDPGSRLCGNPLQPAGDRSWALTGMLSSDAAEGLSNPAWTTSMVRSAYVWPAQRFLVYFDRSESREKSTMCRHIILFKRLNLSGNYWNAGVFDSGNTP